MSFGGIFGGHPGSTESQGGGSDPPDPGITDVVAEEGSLLTAIKAGTVVTVDLPIERLLAVPVVTFLSSSSPSTVDVERDPENGAVTVGLVPGSVITEIDSGTPSTLSASTLAGVTTVGLVAGAVVTAVSSADSAIKVANASGVITLTQQIVATWTIANIRVYAIDGVNGNDANLGYADAATSSSGDYAVACAAAGLVAKKTIAGLAAIFPRIGAGRLVEIVIAAGTYSDSLEILLDGVTGYAFGNPSIRGTVTNSTAGSTAFAGTTAEVTMCGGVTVTGLNAAGYHPTGTPTTSVIQCLTLAGGAPGFAAEPAVPLGWRIRFDSATTTAALRNICRSVCQVTGTDTVLVPTVLPATPVAGDTFYLEQAGVNVPAFTTPSILGATPNSSVGLQFAGIRWTGNSAFADIRARFAFCGSANFFANGQQGGATIITIAQSLLHQVLGTITVGGGMRHEASTQAQFTNIQLVAASLITVGPIWFGGVASATNVQWGVGCVSRNMIVANCSLMPTDGTVSTTTATAPNIGAAVTVGIPRLFGNGSAVPLLIDGCTLRIDAVNITNAGATPAIKLAGVNKLIFSGIVAGSTSNTDVGLDLSNATQTLVEFRSGKIPTVTGTAGDFRMSNQAIGAWSNISVEEIWDQAGNHIFLGAVNGAGYKGSASPSVYNGVLNNGAAILSYSLVAIKSATSGSVRWATADTIANASGLVGAMLMGAADGAHCLFASDGYKVILFDGAAAITPGAVAYLSDSLAAPGTATCTVPVVSATKAKLRLGVVVDTALGSNRAIVAFKPDIYPVLADGNP